MAEKETHHAGVRGSLLGLEEDGLGAVALGALLLHPGELVGFSQPLVPEDLLNENMGKTGNSGTVEGYVPQGTGEEEPGGQKHPRGPSCRHPPIHRAPSSSPPSNRPLRTKPPFPPSTAL